MSNQRGRRYRAPVRRNSRIDDLEAAAPVVEKRSVPLEEAEAVSWPWVMGLAVVSLIIGVWAYWPTLVEMVGAWEREADYSHGYLVVPLAIYFAWARKESFPGVYRRYAWGGLVLMLLAGALRLFAAQFNLGALDGWTILLWVAGAVWLIVGYRAAWWAAPSIGFLFFMVPFPYGLERALSMPLQRIASKLSVTSMQMLGLSAFAEGNVIQLGSYRLEVAQACSGMRIFLGIVALAAAYMILVNRPWWQRLLIAMAVLPIALISNATRIVLTGLLYLFASSEAAQKFSHDFAGWVMIPFAAALFALMLWYLDRLVQVVPVADPRGTAPARQREAESSAEPATA
ncbi:MAG: exosortase/archaeosortase family protein [Planctomycetota bacterium]